MLKKNNLQGPAIYLDEFKSPYNTKEKLLGDKLAILSRTQEIEPLILKKNKSPIKNINYINNDSGKMRHFTPAAQEWYNSIYSYNKNYIKLLPSADKNVMRLLKSYFNFFVSHKILKTKRIPNRYRKLSANKVFVGKGELKHTNNKVIITSYIYNAEQLYLKSLFRKEAISLYYTKTKLKLNTDNLDNKNKYNRPFTLREYLSFYEGTNLNNSYNVHKDVCFKLFWKQYIKLIGIKQLKIEEKKDKEKENNFKNNHGGKEELNIFLKSIDFKLENIFKDTTIPKDIISFIYNNIVSIIKKINIDNGNDNSTLLESLYYNEFKLKDQVQIIFLREFHNISTSNDATYNKFLNLLSKLVEEKNEKKLNEFKKQVFTIRKFYSKFYVYQYLAKEIFMNKFRRIAFLLMINSVKFKVPFVSKLVNFLRNIYKKSVELNIVNVNKMHLNSDIYTQIVALKLKNRDNKLFRVLTWSLNKVNLPNVSRMTERENTSNRDEYLVNKIRNKYINTMFNDNINSDPLNNLLLGIFSSIDNLVINVRKRSSIIKRSTSLYKYIVRSLKHIKLAGVRVEAKGRLTRRFTASRSVFKMRWKGGLKNVDSSFKGLSTTMLRGDRKSNVQYSLINSKNRNGAYGVKGWVSSK